MDPNAVLAEIRLLVTDQLTRGGDPDPELAGLVGALDEWLTRGGFLPDSWKPSSHDSNPAGQVEA